MRLRVLHVGKFYPPARGGMEKVLQVLAEAERSVVDVSVLVANERRGTRTETVHGVPVTRVSALTKVGAVAVCPTFPYWLARAARGVDVIVVHEPNPVALVAHFLARLRTPVIVWVHAEVVRPAWRYRLFYRPFLHRLLRLAGRVVVASPQVREHAGELAAYRDKCEVIPYAIDPDQHAPAPAVTARAAEIRAASPLPHVLFVGRLVPYKGVDILLRALAPLQARCTIVGDGPLRQELGQLAEQLGLTGRVTFAGNAPTDELSALYNACDLFVLPSITKAEAFGMVQIEAMSCRKPVICTDLPSGVPWVNQHGVTGLVVPPGDHEALGRAIAELLADPGRRAQMGEAGRARVLDAFSIERLVSATTRMYAEVAHGRATRAGASAPLAGSLTS